MISKPSKIRASDVRLVQLVDDLGAREMPCPIKQSEARNEAELLPALGSLT
ncbi:MAG: hypothetical protein WA741_09425 [Candidatus Sulfotelmatobacter sp.]